MKYIDFLEKLINLKTRHIQKGLVCTIEKFDSTKFRANVKPLMKYKNAYGEETEYPILTEIPVIVQKQGDYFIKPNYVKGDLVWVGFSTFDILNSLQNYTRAESVKTHELHNACVLGAIVKENYAATTAEKESGLVLGKSSGTVEPAVKGTTFLDALNIFLTTIETIVPGSTAQNAAALTIIKTASTTLKGKIETFKSQDVKIT
jgi:hypothetical protein